MVQVSIPTHASRRPAGLTGILISGSAAAGGALGCDWGRVRSGTDAQSPVASYHRHSAGIENASGRHRQGAHSVLIGLVLVEGSPTEESQPGLSR